MADKKTSQAQHASHPFQNIPDASFTSASARERMPAGAGQIDALLEQAGEAERKGFEQMRTAIDESARLMNEALAWQAQMSSEWRRMTLEAVRRTTDMFGQKPA